MGGFVFLCEFDEWRKMYDQERFNAWLDGEPNEAFSRGCVVPEPGDVFRIDRLNVVHTVLGCTLEEFANASTDMVDRLHDQNARKAIPESFTREYCEARLRTLSLPKSSRIVNVDTGGVVPISAQEIHGGVSMSLSRGAIVANRYLVDSRMETLPQTRRGLVTSLIVTSGSGDVILGDRREMRRLSPPALEVTAGDVLLIAPGTWYAIRNTGTDVLAVSEHAVSPTVVFAP